MGKTQTSSLVLCLLVLTVGSPMVQAQWNVGGNLVTGASNNQAEPRIVTDGAGGAIIIYESSWSGSDTDLFIQRIDAMGVVQWTADGETICNEDGDQIWADLVADGAGGAIMTWSDARSVSSYDVYLQKVDSAGTTQWDADGRYVNSGANSSRVLLDGSGGFFLAWEEWATYPTTIVVQRLSSSGWFSWPAYVTVGGSTVARLVSDGSGGVVVGWQSPTGVAGWGNYIRGQRLDASGVLQWSTTYPSTWISPSHHCYFRSQIAGDGTGGGIWVWDHTTGVVVQRADGTGALQWGTDGVLAFPNVAAPSSLQLISDGAGGALVLAQDGQAGADLYMNRVLTDGTLAWTVNAVVVCNAVETQQSAQLAPDGYGGAYVVWRDNRDYLTNANDIYAQHVDADGNPQWAANGVLISPAAGNQINPQITATGDHSAIITWEDDRNGATNWDLYAQAIHSDGSIGDPPLKVAAVWPLANTIHVPLDTDMKATFSTAVDDATLGSSTFVAHGSLSGLHRGVYSYDAGTRTITLQPSSGFDYGEVVTVVLTDGVKSAGGSPLSPMSWSFTTATEGLRGVFLSAESYAAQVRPIALCPADLDGDGDMDLAAANYDSDSISVLKGHGDGTFANQATYTTGGSKPHGVVAADMDRDGDVDLISANYSGSSVTVFRNTGTAQFAVRHTYPVPGNPESVCAGDFNDDGHMDLATANLGSDEMSVLLNQGDSTFWIAASWAAGDNPIFISCGDLDGDGYLDLVTANLLSDDISVFRNKGTGNFEPKVDIPVGDGAVTVHPADLDKDGDLDLVVAANLGNQMVVLFNNGDATFGPAVTYATGAAPYGGLPADVDGDEDLDLIHTNGNSSNIWVRLNDGSGGFGAETAYGTSPHPNALVAADFDEDGALDLASANRYGDDVTVLLNHATVTGIGTDQVPTVTHLGPNVPNPFNPRTRIDYTLQRDSHVRLSVYNARGEEVVTLVDEYQTAREWSAHWEGRDQSGTRVASGVYFYRLLVGDVEETRKMVLVE